MNELRAVTFSSVQTQVIEAKFSALNSLHNIDFRKLIVVLIISFLAWLETPFLPGHV